MSANKGFIIRQVNPYKGFGAAPSQVVNFGKVLPATTTGNLFSVTGPVLVLSLVGVVTTAFTVTAVKPTLGYTGAPAAIAAAPAAGYASTVVGSVVEMPATLGGQLPAAVGSSGAAASLGGFIVGAATTITITTDATNTGALDWLLTYIPLQRKYPGAVTAL